MSPGPGMAEHETCHREQEERGGLTKSKGFQGLTPLAQALEEKRASFPRLTWPHLAPSLTYPCALRKLESTGLAGSPLVSRKG